MAEDRQREKTDRQFEDLCARALRGAVVHSKFLSPEAAQRLKNLAARQGLLCLAVGGGEGAERAFACCAARSMASPCPRRRRCACCASALIPALAPRAIATFWGPCWGLASSGIALGISAWRRAAPMRPCTRPGLLPLFQPGEGRRMQRDRGGDGRSLAGAQGRQAPARQRAPPCAWTPACSRCCACPGQGPGAGARRPRAAQLGGGDPRGCAPRPGRPWCPCEARAGSACWTWRGKSRKNRLFIDVETFLK